MMKLLHELNGKIISVAGRPQKMDCLTFDCPVCVDPHQIMVSWSKPSLFQNGATWTKTITGFNESIEIFSLFPSINCDVPWKDEQGIEHPSSCKFHGWVTNGVVSWS